MTKKKSEATGQQIWPDLPAERCEWDPEQDAPAQRDRGCPNEAVWSLGNGSWHLCDSCIKLPRFSHFHTLTRLKKVEER